MTDRELRQVQEDRLYENLVAQTLLKKGKSLNLEQYLAMTEEKAQNGMTAEEIDAVKERVKRAVKKMTGEGELND